MMVLVAALTRAKEELKVALMINLFISLCLDHMIKMMNHGK